jgi:hypothetical protein
MLCAAFATIACASAPVRDPDASVQGRRRPARSRALAPELAVLRTGELHAGRVRARVIHAHAVRADGGRVRRVLPDDPASRAPESRATRVDADVIVADVIYADSVEARFVEAREIHAAEVEIGRGHRGQL